MSIRKVALPDDNYVYEIDGAGKASTLYAGTLVSQVMPSLDELHSGLQENVRVFWFDKTGALTREGLLFLVNSNQLTRVGDQFMEDPVDIGSYQTMQYKTCVYE
ncbi:hypothetical protein BD408DRAFT_428347 [Parasitella parasitica]|nr:hypothetical protein BD408DRAFT_428347 [Parasitella parasitica]